MIGDCYVERYSRKVIRVTKTRPEKNWVDAVVIRDRDGRLVTDEVTYLFDLEYFDNADMGGIQ
jgi:hypothetical protein